MEVVGCCCRSNATHFTADLTKRHHEIASAVTECKKEGSKEGESRMCKFDSGGFFCIIKMNQAVDKIALHFQSVGFCGSGVLVSSTLTDIESQLYKRILVSRDVTIYPKCTVIHISEVFYCQKMSIKQFLIYFNNFFVLSI